MFFGMMDGRVDLVIDGACATERAPPTVDIPSRPGASSGRGHLKRKEIANGLK